MRLHVPWCSKFKLRFPRILIVARDSDSTLLSAQEASEDRSSSLDPRAKNFDFEHYRRLRVEYYQGRIEPETHRPTERRSSSVAFEESSITSPTRSTESTPRRTAEAAARDPTPTPAAAVAAVSAAAAAAATSVAAPTPLPAAAATSVAAPTPLPAVGFLVSPRSDVSEKRLPLEGPGRSKMAISRSSSITPPLSRTSSTVVFSGADEPCATSNGPATAAPDRTPTRSPSAGVALPLLSISERSADSESSDSLDSMSFEDTSTGDSPPTTPKGSSFDDFSWVEVGSSVMLPGDEQTSSTGRKRRSRRSGTSSKSKRQSAQVLAARSSEPQLGPPPQVTDDPSSSAAHEMANVAASIDSSLASGSSALPASVEALAAAAALLEALVLENEQLEQQQEPEPTMLLHTTPNPLYLARGSSGSLLDESGSPVVVPRERIISVSSSSSSSSSSAAAAAAAAAAALSQQQAAGTPDLGRRRARLSLMMPVGAVPSPSIPIKSRSASLCIPNEHQQTIDQLIYLQTKLADLMKENQLLQQQYRAAASKQEKVRCRCRFRW